ncbi:MAG: hypothetical protein AAGB18_05755 [Pseudomonadota bacterium]
MARQIALHLSMGPEEAAVIKDAAHRAHMRPSQYALDRLCRVATYEVAVLTEKDAAPSDIDDEAEGDALLMLQGTGERLQRWRAKKRKDEKPKPPGR